MNSNPRFKDRYWLHILLFCLTLISTMWAGTQMAGRATVYLEAPALFFIAGFPITVPYLMDGFLFGGSLLLFLTFHEFGHYFAARFHKVDTSLPYYIPFPFNGIGTFGAVIRIRQQIPSMTRLFDIGIAGPLAGFVIALGILLIGFSTLPGFEYLNGIPGHEALLAYLAQYGTFPAKIMAAENGQTMLMVGTTPLYWMLSQLFTDVPPMWEMYHYPVLFAGWLGMFFTALNLLPVGQLDGGHILYALVGPKWHGIIARVFVSILLVSGGIGFVDEVRPALDAWHWGYAPLVWPLVSSILFFFVHKMFAGSFRMIIPIFTGLVLLIAFGTTIPTVVDLFGYSGWFVWCLLIMVLIKVDHPPVAYREELTPRRKVLAVLSIVIFLLCFSLKPLYLV